MLVIALAPAFIRNIEKEKQEEERRKLEEKNKAKSVATALQTIGKFVIKKKAGVNDQIFGR